MKKKSGAEIRELISAVEQDPPKAHVRLRLAQYGKDDLVSRSQAKRVLARFERFKELDLDFSGIDSIGPAFADEIFRVYAANHPEIKLIALNAIEQVNEMIGRVLAETKSSEGSH